MPTVVCGLLAIILLLVCGMVQEAGTHPVSNDALIGLAALAGFFTGVLLMALAMYFDLKTHPAAPTTEPDMEGVTP